MVQILILPTFSFLKLFDKRLRKFHFFIIFIFFFLKYFIFFFLKYFIFYHFHFFLSQIFHFFLICIFFFKYLIFSKSPFVSFSKISFSFYFFYFFCYFCDNIFHQIDFCRIEIYRFLVSWRVYLYLVYISFRARGMWEKWLKILDQSMRTKARGRPTTNVRGPMRCYLYEKNRNL